MKITYYVAASQDGFIAKEDGDVSWLDEMNIDMVETGYDEFFESIDGLIMGRNTYDFIYNLGSWPYDEKLAWVCTNRELEILEGANIRITPNIDEVVKESDSKGLKHLWLIGGGKLASSFLNEGFLTNLVISEMPIKLDSGIPLFADHRLEEISVEKTNLIEKKGFTQKHITLLKELKSE